MSKRLRQQAIKELVQKGRVQNQAVLAKELKKLGFNVTQATLSRDIACLRLVKSKDGYIYPEGAGAASQNTIQDSKDTLKRLVLKVDLALNQLVLKTPVGNASPVAIAVEECQFEGVIGTIGGDDTTLVIARSEEDAKRIQKELIEMLL